MNTDFVISQTDSRPMYLQIMEQVMGALEHAHERGIVHRDLKPANILLKPQTNGTEMVKVLDFGIAKAMRDENQDMKTLTQAGHVLGTPHYMSPEQISGDDIDHRADLYAMGVILYELLVGEHPFEGSSPTAVMVAHLRDDPPALPPALEHTKWGLIVREALHKQPDDRLASATQFLDLLRSEHDLIDANESNEVTALFTQPNRPPAKATAAPRRHKGPAFAPVSSLEQVSEQTLVTQSPADATTQWRRIEEKPQLSNFGAEPLASPSPSVPGRAFPQQPAPHYTPVPHLSQAPPLADPAATLDLPDAHRASHQRGTKIFAAFGALATLAILIFVITQLFMDRASEHEVDRPFTQQDARAPGAPSVNLAATQRDEAKLEEPSTPSSIDDAKDAGLAPEQLSDMKASIDQGERTKPEESVEKIEVDKTDTAPEPAPIKRPQPSFVELQINSSPGNSTVHINRRLVGNTPLTYKLKQSDKTISISVSHLGFKKETRTIKPNKDRTLTFTLDKGLMLTPH